MKTLFLILFSFVFTFGLIAQEYLTLWPNNKIPNSKGLKLQYIEENQRITQVSNPGMYVFLASKEVNNGSAVLICPSGGYQKLTYNLGGFQFAKWLNTLGVNAFVLIYRLPISPDLIEREKGPIQDAQRAMKIIRANAGLWNIDTLRVGIMGSSAGGHLASTLGTHNEDFSQINDTIDKFSFNPDFMILISPVINMGEYTHKGSRENFLGLSPSEKMVNLYSNELQVTKNTPPVFLVHAQNDNAVSPMNSILFYEAALRNNVNGSLHVFPQGGHSIGLRNNPGSTDEWTILCEKWMSEMGIIKSVRL